MRTSIRCACGLTYHANPPAGTLHADLNARLFDTLPLVEDVPGARVVRRCYRCHASIYGEPRANGRVHFMRVVEMRQE